MRYEYSYVEPSYVLRGRRRVNLLTVEVWINWNLYLKDPPPINFRD